MLFSNAKVQFQISNCILSLTIQINKNIGMRHKKIEAS
ncbi:hypothetical protein HMPREF9303_2157 [Prevotella denticola CRIS 18C-A]|uniref:Uncharacterized protein n=1 Tax=Prevotella denticola CRIS 18C-A TaxID=944557 RepID=F0H445_9BACT|nr:hypothetical protein HMPREF9303_2157 [Prevotella denticola CRIS 18C-A]